MIYEQITFSPGWLRGKHLKKNIEEKCYETWQKQKKGEREREREREKQLHNIPVY